MSNFEKRRGAGEQHEREPIGEVLRRVETAIADEAKALRGGVEVAKPAAGNGADPAPSETAVARQQVEGVVGGITLKVLSELRGLRDEIDALTRDVNDRRDLISDAIRAHAEFTESAIQHRQIMSEALTRMRAEFESSRTPLPPVRKV